MGEEAFIPECEPDNRQETSQLSVVVLWDFLLHISCVRRVTDVTIFESMPKAGGMLRYGIPEYRLPKEVLDEEIADHRKDGRGDHHQTLRSV